VAIDSDHAELLAVSGIEENTDLKLLVDGVALQPLPLPYAIP